MNITANSTEMFNKIKESLIKLDDNGCFLSFFDNAVESDKVENMYTITNYKKFRKDLNLGKYIILIPDNLVIDSFEIVQGIQRKDCASFYGTPTFSVIIKSHLSNDDMIIGIVLTGFNDNNIRIIRTDDLQICNCDVNCSLKN